MGHHWHSSLGWVFRRRGPFAISVVLVLLVVSSLLEGCQQDSEAAHGDEYGRRCNEIVAHASAAAQLHNGGRPKEAVTKLRDAEASFHAARKIKPNEPQAHANIAVAMLNAQRFDEATGYWKEAGQLMPEGRTRDWAEGMSRWSVYLKLSMVRDRVYNRGQGNLTQTLELMSKQIDIYPDFPLLHHDRATMLVMLSALQSNRTAEAVEEFATSQEASLGAWRAGVRRSGGTCCQDCGGVVYDWPRHLAERGGGGALAALDWLEESSHSQHYGDAGSFKDEGSYVARFADVGVAGDDGLIVDQTECHIFLASSNHWVNAANNLQMLELWKGPAQPHEGTPYHAWYDFSFGSFPNAGKATKVRRVAKVASIVQFAGTSFFHFMTEVLGRLLVLLRKGVLDDPEVKLLAKRGAKHNSSKGSFMGEAFDLLAADLVSSGRVIWHKVGGPPDVRLRAETLYFADWRPPAEPGADGGHCATPRSVLGSVRAALGRGGEQGTGEDEEGTQPVLVAISRAGQPMRGKLADEAQLLEGLADVAAEASPALAFRRFAGGESVLQEQVAVFRRARVVVGVHGGALTNILFCRAGALVFELGFMSPFAGHYRHIAAAMGLNLTVLPLLADARGMASNEVQLRDGVDAALAAVRAKLGIQALGPTADRIKHEEEL